MSKDYQEDNEVMPTAIDMRAFMAENVEQDEEREVLVSERFRNPDTGEVIKWRIKSISSAQDRELRKKHTHRVKVGRAGQSQKETDYESYMLELAALCVVYPDLQDAALQNSYGVMGETALLQALLSKPGELAELQLQVQKHNGFDVLMDDLVDEAKN